MSLKSRHYERAQVWLIKGMKSSHRGICWPNTTVGSVYTWTASRSGGDARGLDDNGKFLLRTVYFNHGPVSIVLSAPVNRKKGSGTKIKNSRQGHHPRGQGSDAGGICGRLLAARCGV